MLRSICCVPGTRQGIQALLKSGFGLIFRQVSCPRARQVVLVVPIGAADSTFWAWMIQIRKLRSALTPAPASFPLSRLIQEKKFSFEPEPYYSKPMKISQYMTRGPQDPSSWAWAHEARVWIDIILVCFAPGTEGGERWEDPWASTDSGRLKWLPLLPPIFFPSLPMMPDLLLTERSLLGGIHNNKPLLFCPKFTLHNHWARNGGWKIFWNGVESTLF